MDPQPPDLLNYLSAFSSLVSIIVTLALVYITCKYTKATQKMAEVMAKDYEYRINPIVEFTTGSSSISYPEYISSFTLRNIGYFVCYVRKIKLVWYLVKDPEKKGMKTLEEDEKVINPGSNYPPPYSIRLTENDFAQLNIETTRGRYSIGKDIKVMIELEIAGPDKKFYKRTYFIC